MKPLFQIELVVLCVLFAYHSEAQNNWEAIGPANIPIFSFGVNGSNLFAGGIVMRVGVFVTTNDDN